MTKIPFRASDFRSSMADDILHGADEIALEIFGDRKMRRRVYHLAETSQLPVFKLGSKVCARRTTLRKWIEDQEARAADAARK